MAKKFFESKGISFEEVNVEQDQQKAAEMVEKSGQMGVPVIEINGEIIIGFNRPEIERALSKE
jgi:glutaredoxin